MCSQVISTGPEAGQDKGEEDCLNLNIFLPRDRDWLLPVMVWIHGGAFVEGSGQEGTPDPLIERGVMVVMINYRYDIRLTISFILQNSSSQIGCSGVHDFW